MASTPKPPPETYLLVSLLVFLSFMAIYGGISLMIDPFGESLKFSTKNASEMHLVKDFLIPGIFLFVLFGLFPLLLVFPLLKKPKIKWAGAFNIYPRRYWAWTYAIFTGFSLIIWSNAEIYLIGYQSDMQLMVSFYGLAIIFVCLLPEQMMFFSKWKTDIPHPQDIPNEKNY